ncbi:DNA gyrase/topoisomerase IV subunit A [Elizabethkingia meningoseptica]|uniref:DNA gyrase/topoisomerase IV subunit A n=1 Tax=Elizabethkingia meningoseptica TaxID=238 RepID=UPI0022F176C6|nr:DNA gyrase/topoisomerase IV subunit A [Elizabethkingia meningoseptica]EJK5327738.1 DNA gyrase/topoisomerase IV subunit A [Elizabethkingia meningoseptica]MDE5436388.1 DNA gyrase/topoisomerase IV subunit A [Elizabethkingia meningoseptica]MDE5508412.1 DNA gyrase/topoisomerase IV subunit A [Elizabethkingia meningoseptica]MDE5515102.1 DNA gyrase/topoisomerase IV subunit A [Elizabethkingia meningoseptica]MDE5529368.1 DNA gyrase/topoisomerase IV subunit A [Elizabethkingia meningoseptica]
MEENNINHAEESLKKVSGLYQDWFLDYASYVILDRAIPSVYDGLKPVQRRIMHSMRELEDGRYNKVANIVGNTMKYHPHGDASITDAMVQIGQKELLIDTQGNWGNIFTGDSAAAARYIEARLTPFALEVVFNPKTTEWAKSYDGRNNEPIDLPVKFPLLLAQGVEGIGVGLSTKILPHNFNELINASVAYLKKKPFQLYPDFLTEGLLDVSEYNDGQRGGKVRARARISQKDKHTLVVTELPFSKTTGDLIDSIIKANEKGKIKIKKIEDNTSDKVEILIHLHPDVSPDKTIDALYAFTDCQVTISPNACVIVGDKPMFLNVSEILRMNTDHTVSLLKLELEIELGELEEKWHFASLEKIFIENEIYQEIKNRASKEEVYNAIDLALKPFTAHLMREVTTEDIIRLTELPFMRISRYDQDKALENIVALEGKIEQVKHHLANLITYAIDYYQNIQKKYGKNKERRTELRIFDTIDATKVAVANEKFYANFDEGFIGTSLKKDEFLFECSDIDDIIIFRKDGTMLVTKVESKTFVGKNILHVGIWKKNDKRTVYNMIYREGKEGPYYMKRFFVTGVIRSNEYNLASDKKGSEVLYFSANANGEAEVVNVLLKPSARIRKNKLDVDFSELAIKGRDSKGNLVTKYPVKKIEMKEEGVSTLAPRKIWFDEAVRRLNADARGTFLGTFKGEDKILLITPKGEAKLVSFDLSNRFDDEYLILEKWKPQQPVSCIYYDGEKERYFIKRFLLENTNNPQAFFLSEHAKSFVEWVSTDKNASAELIFSKEKGKDKDPETILVDEFITVKGIKALGNQLSKDKIRTINISIPEPEEEEEIIEEIEDSNEDFDDDGTIGNLFEEGEE